MLERSGPTMNLLSGPSSCCSNTHSAWMPRSAVFRVYWPFLVSVRVLADLVLRLSSHPVTFSILFLIYRSTLATFCSFLFSGAATHQIFDKNCKKTSQRPRKDRSTFCVSGSCTSRIDFCRFCDLQSFSLYDVSQIVVCFLKGEQLSYLIVSTEFRIVVTTFLVTARCSTAGFEKRTTPFVYTRANYHFTHNLASSSTLWKIARAFIKTNHSHKNWYKP